MALRDPLDIPFSELKNNCEPRQARIMKSLYHSANRLFFRNHGAGLQDENIRILMKKYYTLTV